MGTLKAVWGVDFSYKIVSELKPIDELHEKLYLIEVMIPYMVFRHNSLPILLCISCKKVLKEASNIVHNNIKRGGEGFVLWKVAILTPITLLI